MKGGSFDYIDQQLKHELFDRVDKPNNVFEDRELSELVWDVFDLIHAYDCYHCNESKSGSFIKAKTRFKDKWLTSQRIRVKRIIDDAMSQVRDELYQTYAQDYGYGQGQRQNQVNGKPEPGGIK